MNGFYVAVCFVAAFATIYGVFKLYADRKVRLKALEMMNEHPELIKDGEFNVDFKEAPNHYRGLKIAGLIMGFGVGFIISTLFTGNIFVSDSGYVGVSQNQLYVMLSTGSIMLFGSLGLVLGVLVERALTRRDAKRD